ncbi:TPA: HNH endonuclease [Escherichia coli]|nr:HNH endonuclease [Escherichia coli]
MSRVEFLRSLGATCKNYNWSWSFIDETNKRIIFGAWDHLKSADGKSVLILSHDWRVDSQGRKKPGYKQSIEHINKILYDGYSLYIFYQIRQEKTTASGAAKIKDFEKNIVRKYLTKINSNWYATDEEHYSYTPEIDNDYYEGRQLERLATYYERDPKARQACIDAHGYTCHICGFNFEKVYGSIGKNYIQVHHIKPLHHIAKYHKVDPVNDLIPLCANCHVMIHNGMKVRTIEQLREILERTNHSN